MSAHLLLFDDARARRWEPFALTRPAGELLLGCLRQRERGEHFWGLPCAGHLAGEARAGFREEGAAPALQPDDVDPDHTRVLLSSRVVLPFEAPPSLEAVSAGEAAVLLVGGEAVGWLLPPGAPLPPEEALLEPATAPRPDTEVELGGRVVGDVWNLVAENPEQLAVDIPRLHPRSDAFLPPGVHHVGRGLVSVARDVELEPGITMDTRSGPIRIESGAVVRSLTRLEGPLFIGRDTLVLGGSIGRASIGPRCKVRGEVDESIVLGYSNKAHDGFLGHAYLGRWVNLGAGTTNSDLKNNYGPVRVRTSEGPRETGLTKVGCFLGDHVKTAIGTRLNTGTVVGAGSNLFGDGMPPIWVPPFTWGGGEGSGAFRLDRFLEVAEVVMERRDVALGEDERAFLEAAWRRARGNGGGSDGGGRGESGGGGGGDGPGGGRGDGGGRPG